jgi:hypothetical protein
LIINTLVEFLSSLLPVSRIDPTLNLRMRPPKSCDKMRRHSLAVPGGGHAEHLSSKS